MKHTPLTAAKAIRALFEENIAKTKSDYARQQNHDGFWLDAHRETLLVQEQCNGIDYGIGGVAATPFSYDDCAEAVMEIMPELFADYWQEVFTNHTRRMLPVKDQRP